MGGFFRSSCRSYFYAGTSLDYADFRDLCQNGQHLCPAHVLRLIQEDAATLIGCFSVHVAVMWLADDLTALYGNDDQALRKLLDGIHADQCGSLSCGSLSRSIYVVASSTTIAELREVNFSVYYPETDRVRDGTGRNLYFIPPPLLSHQASLAVVKNKLAKELGFLPALPEQSLIDHRINS